LSKSLEIKYKQLTFSNLLMYLSFDKRLGKIDVKDTAKKVPKTK